MNIAEIAAEHLVIRQAEIKHIDDKVSGLEKQISNCTQEIKKLIKMKEKQQLKLEGVTEFISSLNKKPSKSPRKSIKAKKGKLASNSLSRAERTEIWWEVLENMPTSSQTAIDKSQILSIAERLGLNVTPHATYMQVKKFEEQGVVKGRKSGKTIYWYRADTNIVDLPINTECKTA